MAYNARPNQTSKYTQGYYELINESKYISNPNQIIYRSSLELKFCKFLDDSKKEEKMWNPTRTLMVLQLHGGK